jgi:hypothetical protein
MRTLRVVAMVGAIMGGYVALPSVSASAAPVPSDRLANPVASSAVEDYMHYRRYWHRHYVPRRPRFVCRWVRTRYGARRICYRRW